MFLWMPCIRSSAEQGGEVIGSSSPVAVNRFAEERVSMRRSAKVSFHFTLTSYYKNISFLVAKYIYTKVQKLVGCELTVTTTCQRCAVVGWLWTLWFYPTSPDMQQLIGKTFSFTYIYIFLAVSLWSKICTMSVQRPWFDSGWGPLLHTSLSPYISRL